jgi:hypothetical protein
MRPSGSTLRVAALVAVAALALHELRYLIGFGGDAGAALEARGHGYLGAAGLAVALLVALAAGELLVAVRRSLRSATASPQAPFGVLWMAASCALVVVYAGQEMAEGLLTSGHPDGVATLAAANGWVAVPLAVAIGAVVALLLRGSAAVEALAAARGARSRPAPRRGLQPSHPAPAPTHAPATSLLSRNLAGRAPPRVAHAHP